MNDIVMTEQADDVRWGMNQSPPPSERRSGWLPPFVFLLGLVAWVGAGAAWVKMDDDVDAIDVVSYQTAAIVLAVIGVGLVIIATLYDIASRWR